MELRWYVDGEEQVLICGEDEVEEQMQWVRDEFGVEATIVKGPSEGYIVH